MRRERRLRRYSGLRGLGRRSPLLKYGRYSRYGKYGRFYSEEEVLNDPKLAKELEKIEQEVSQFPTLVDEILDTVEEVEEKDPEGFEEAMQEVQEELQGKVNSRTFSQMARARIYNMTPEEFAEAKRNAMEVAEIGTEILGSNDLDDVEVEIPKKTLVGRIISSILGYIVAGFKKLRDAIVGFFTAIRNNDEAFGLYLATLIGGIGLPLAIYVNHYLLRLYEPIQVWWAPDRLVAPVAVGVVALVVLIGLALVWLLGKRNLNDEQKKFAKDSAEALKEASPVVRKIKQEGLDSVDPKQLASLAEKHKQLLERGKRVLK